MNCAYSLCSEQLSSANKREEQSDERLAPTGYELVFFSNQVIKSFFVNLHKCNIIFRQTVPKKEFSFWWIFMVWVNGFDKISWRRVSRPAPQGVYEIKEQYGFMFIFHRCSNVVGSKCLSLRSAHFTPRIVCLRKTEGRNSHFLGF